MDEGPSFNEQLPSGVKVPFERWGPWRMLVVYASVLMSVCAVWIGLTRRRSLQLLFTAMAANAFFWPSSALAQRATDADKIFWFWSSPASYFVSSFVYKNHAGAYFNLLLTLCAGLALWHYERGLRRLDKSSPSGVFAFFGTAVVLLVIFSYSRTATLLMFTFLLVAVGIFFWRQKRQPEGVARSPIAAILVVGALGAFVYLGMKSLRTEQFLTKISELQQQLETTGPGFRTLAPGQRGKWPKTNSFLAGVRVLFVSVFPTYQRRIPEISMSGGRPLYWEHAHNDYLELLAEFGLVGGALIASMIGFVMIKALRVGVWRNPVSLFLGLGCGIVAIHSIVDFHAYNPAILTTFCVFAVSMIPLDRD